MSQEDQVDKYIHSLEDWMGTEFRKEDIHTGEKHFLVDLSQMIPLSDAGELEIGIRLSSVFQHDKRMVRAVGNFSIDGIPITPFRNKKGLFYLFWDNEKASWGESKWFVDDTFSFDKNSLEIPSANQFPYADLKDELFSSLQLKDLTILDGQIQFFQNQGVVILDEIRFSFSSFKMMETSLYHFQGLKTRVLELSGDDEKGNPRFEVYWY